MNRARQLHKISSIRYFGLFLASIPAVVLLILFISGWSWPDETSDPVSDFLVEFPILPEEGNPLNIVVQDPGHVWFTMPLSNAIGSLIVTSTTNYQFDFFVIPTSDSHPYDLVYDHVREGVWFTEHKANKIAFLEPSTGIFTETIITTPASAPAGIALAPDGTLWFVEQDADQLASFDPDSNTLSEFLYSLSGDIREDVVMLEDVVVANPSSIWFTAPGVHRVVRFVPDTEDFLSIPVNSGPTTPTFAAHRVINGSSGQIWITAPEMDKIGLYVPGTTTLWRWYGLPAAANAGLAGLAYSWHDGRHILWYTESETGFVGFIAIDVTGRVVAARRHALSSPSSKPIGIAVDSNEQAWIAEYEGEMIAAWYPPYNHASFLPVLSH